MVFDRKSESKINLHICICVYLDCFNLHNIVINNIVAKGVGSTVFQSFTI